MADLKFWHDGCDIYIAIDETDADRLYREHTGLDHEQVVSEDSAEPWREIRKEPGQEIALFDENEGKSIKKTREEWIAHRGAGYFGSTEY